MKLNQILKGMLIVIPALAMTACSSTSGVDAESETAINESAGNGGVNGSGPELGGINAPMTPEEIQREKYAELRQEHILYFDYDRSDIRPEFAQMLEAHAAFLVENQSTRVIVEGHADERGTPEYNIALSERRGKAVQRYLQSLGVLSSQMEVVPYGEEKLLDSAATDAAHAKNRRAVLVY
ncbi:peptidoglycan-associated lipoprotein Pal [Ferrimonas lipolytica]|uniref:Peptidoglycan-associated lipoprotein n=1 Tax=Ferrimonas lipolytica TaxID=2724191 RepID=A0A6H1UBB6_9GAMM|nr:peptidoglycan-associated lipoprotein Pal [Ferrimonas lipolytica]QIZ76351.1 peptidoglycan-associated lipoprotein Pal [Ferrimonas lipolytica]